MFMIGHDCDHNAFATSEFVNDVFGNIAHTFLGVPYYMWKVSAIGQIFFRRIDLPFVVSYVTADMYGTVC